jgi:hypothetical protein
VWDSSVSVYPLVGLGNLLLAGGVLLIVQRLDGGREAKVVEEVRDLVLADIEAEALVVQNELLQVRDEISEMRLGIVKLVTNPMDALGPRLLVPATAALAKLVMASGKSTGMSRKKMSPKTNSGVSSRKAKTASPKAVRKRTKRTTTSRKG